MSNLRFYVGSNNLLSVSLIDSSGAPILGATVSSTITPTNSPLTIIWAGPLPEVGGGVYEEVLPAGTFDGYADVSCTALTTAELPPGTFIATSTCAFVPRVNECSSIYEGGGQGDLATMVQRIQEEMDQQRALDSNPVIRAIISSLEDYRWKPFFFNKFWFAWQAQAAVKEYGPSGTGEGWPKDLLWITNMELAYPNSQTIFWDVIPVSQSNIHEWNRIRNARGIPKYFKWFAEKIVLGPIPNQDFDIECDGVKDLGTPAMKFTDGKWYFYDPNDPTRNLDMAYSNAFFTWGERLLRASAKAKIYLDVIGSAEKGSVAKAIEQDEFKKLTENTEKRQVPRTSRQSWGW